MRAHACAWSAPCAVLCTSLMSLTVPDHEDMVTLHYSPARSPPAERTTGDAKSAPQACIPALTLVGLRGRSSGFCRRNFRQPAARRKARVTWTLSRSRRLKGTEALPLTQRREASIGRMRLPYAAPNLEAEFAQTALRLVSHGAATVDKFETRMSGAATMWAKFDAGRCDAATHTSRRGRSCASSECEV
jgi:hypothetical protein